MSRDAHIENGTPAAPPGPARTSAHPGPVPRTGPDGAHDLDDPAYYLNRELTWLNFNERVLHEAEDERTPLLERLKFVAIVSNNLDEFFMKRIGGLKQQVGARLTDRTPDGRTPQEQIDESYGMVRDLERRKRAATLGVLEELSGHDVHVASWDALDDADRAWLRELYLDNIYPLVTPQATDPAHPFPFISNLSLNLLVTLNREREPGRPASIARVKVPVGAGIPRLLRVRDSRTYVRMEEVMANTLDLLFPGMDVTGCALFRVTRNANTERDEEQADDLLALIESELRDRKFAPVVRLEVSDDMSPAHRGMLASELGLDEQSDVFVVEGMLGTGDLMEIVDIGLPELRDKAHHPVDHPDLKTDRNVFHIIRDEGSILLHHPYQSFPTSVERLLREASTDPKVRAIKMALYRTSEASKSVQYLIDAARNGKQVAVMVELKARFDEAANIRWASRLEEVGIHVTYGVVGLKTHCKIILVVRQDHDGLRRYAHVGTGNYHAGTARVYSDTGLITSDEAIGADLTELTNYLTTGYKPRRDYRRILPSPKLCKAALLERIRREVAAHTDAAPGRIQFKTNALEDVEITRALYEAAAAGVQVDLLVRDTCRLRPGIPGLSGSVRVISIVGRFLEHSRIYYFRNGGDEEYFIGSADIMRRNLESRVEVLVPVESGNLRKELRLFLDTQLGDERSAWEMQPDGSYVQRTPGPGANGRGSHEALILWHGKRDKEVTRLRRRKPRGLGRNLR